MQCSRDTHILILTRGEETFMAANGAELHGEFEYAVLIAPTRIVTGVFLFLDGTGRFEEASGSPGFAVMQDLSGPFEVTGIGSINF
jgi:hypothetical protein